MLEKKIIVITGGPGSGKTTLVNALNKKGYSCFNEISREIILQARKNGIEQLFLEDPIMFSNLLLEGREKQYLDAKNLDSNVVFIDRGLPDVIAYLDGENIPYPIEFKEKCITHKYNQVFILPPWEEIYVNDESRYENFEMAHKIYHNLRETYQELGYSIVEIPKLTVEERILFLENTITL